MSSVGARLRLELDDKALVAMRRAFERTKRQILADLEPHRRTGDVERGIHYRVRKNVRSITGTIEARAPGSSFLDEGTQTPIMSSRAGGKMAVPLRHPGPPIEFRSRVRGQKATRFFTRNVERLADELRSEIGRIL